ncbi:MAG: hypothetical protein AXA67_03595 [Methylothermaceae bacteria B42]|nr:MAG: hypothetical protein AXA67_03595 [Methylothermaceae bacteria B42]HHJ38186.1 hypothetical protein [Methylothermaceae bacterium]
MKKTILLILLLMVVAGLFWGRIAPVTGAYAVSGCCKVRKSERDPWRKHGTDLAACKSMNRAQDGDNIFKPNGAVWWDMNC